MDLKEYLGIFRRYSGTFLLCVVLVLGVAFGWAMLRAESYSTLLSINVGRTVQENVQSQEYTYDDFYRLQADERFADTLVRWLSSPRVVLDIYEEAGISSLKTQNDSLAKQFKARRLASQYIEVSFTTTDQRIAEEVTSAMEKVLNERTMSLNSGSDGQPWFKVLVDKPVIEKNAVDYIHLLGIGLLLGVFLGFWVVLIRHYFREDTN